MIIALDMDGTLLNTEGKVSNKNKEAIIQAQENGHIVTIATGRSLPNARRPLQEVGLICPIIGLNGATITLADGTLFANYPLTKTELVPLFNWVKEQPELYIEMYTDKGVFVGLHNRKELEELVETVDDSPKAEDLRRIVRSQFQQAVVQYLENIEKVWLDNETTIYKVLLFSLDKDKLKKAATRFESIPGYIITSSHENNIEINHIEATKGNALKSLASHFNIDMSDSIVMGDSLNDLPMFEVGAHRVAMANATSIIKRKSTLITLTNKDDGVAHALEKLLHNVTV